MADENYRRLPPNDPYGRAPAAAPGGNDPLVELARLIGQTDPFGEFANRQPQARQTSPAAQWSADAAEAPYQSPPVTPEHDPYAAHPHAAYEPQGAPFPAETGPYQAGYADPGYGQMPVQGGYDPRGRAPDDIYDDAPPRRRVAIIAIAAVFALAVIGTAGAFGYRALFGGTGSAPPPVIKAETTPSKVVPAANSGEPQSNKLIYDRVGERPQNEKIVSREEQPVDLKDRVQSAVISNSAPGATAQTASLATANEPKKIRTIAIRPDQATGAPEPAPATAPAPSSSRAQAPTRPATAAPTRVASVPPVETANAEITAPKPVATRSVAPRSSNAPLSLNPNAAPDGPPAAPVPARTAAAPAREAPAASNGVSGAYAVQVSSQRSEADAQASFRSLQGKFPGQLGSRQALIRRADLGSKGTYYQAMVGPFASAGEAGEFCSSLKAAGGQCFVKKN